MPPETVRQNSQGVGALRAHPRTPNSLSVAPAVRCLSTPYRAMSEGTPVRVFRFHSFFRSPANAVACP